MNKAEIIRGIDMTIEGLTLIKTSLSSEEEVMPTPVASVEDSAPIGKLSYTREQLNGMKYNEFKKLAASLGVKCTGTRDEIMNRILDLGTVPAENEEEVPADETPVEKTEVVEEETTEDKFVAQAKEIAESTSAEDIIEALKDVDVKATKKNYVEKLAEALRNGLLDVDDDEDESDEDESEVEDEEVEEPVAEESDEDSEDEDDSDDDEEVGADSYFEQFDPNGFNNPDDMTEERQSAVLDAMDKLLTDYSEGKISDDEVQKFIEENSTDEEIELLGDDYTEDDLFMFFMELKKRFIDNDGETHDKSDPYELGEEDFCCGHKLKYSKKTKKYICEICGTEYEAE